MKKVIVIFIALSLSACASTVVPPSQAKQAPSDRIYKYQNFEKEQSQLTVVRDSGFTGGGCYADVFINGEKVATLDPKEKASFALPPGEWAVGAQIMGKGLCGQSGQRQERYITLAPSEKKSARVFIDGDGNLDIRPTTLQ